MSGRDIQKGATNVSTVIRIIDSTTGLPELAVEHDESGIDLWFRRETEVSTDITEAALAALTTAHTDGGLEHINDGYYRLDPPDAAWVDSAGIDGVMIGGAITNMIVIGTYHALVAHDPVTQPSDIHSRLVVIESAADSDQIVDATATSNIHSRLVIVESSIDSDQLVDATATSNIHSRLVIVESSIDSDQVINDAANSDIESALVLVDVDNSNIHSRLVIIESSIDSDQVVDATATSNIHSRLVIVESSIDSDQLINDTANSDIESALVLVDVDTSNIHSRLVIIEASVDSDQLVDATATSNIHSRLVVVESSIDSDQLINDAANSDIESSLVALFTTAMTESYAADGVAPTLAQAIFLIQQNIQEFAISGTTITTKKLDGSTTAATYTLDDGTSPTSRTRAT